MTSPDQPEVNEEVNEPDKPTTAEHPAQATEPADAMREDAGEAGADTSARATASRPPTTTPTPMPRRPDR